MATWQSMRGSVIRFVGKLRASFNTSAVVWASVSLAALSAYLLRGTLVGDAQVHLAFAENFAGGHPFEYNVAGDQVMASSSPLWTMLLWASFSVVHLWTPVVLKVLVSGLWCGLCYAFATAAIRSRPGDTRIHWAACLAFVLNPVISVNSLGGMENVLTAVQVLLIVALVSRRHSRVTWRTTFSVGALWGVAALTRADGAILCAIPILFWLLARRKIAVRRLWVSECAVVLGAAVLVALPWYVFQIQSTGGVSSDSVLSRVLHGRRSAWEIAPGVFFNGKPAIATLVLLLPILVCACAGMKRAWASIGASLRGTSDPGAFAIASHTLIVFWALLFYSFVVGGDHYGRYFLPVFPSIYLLAVSGWPELRTWSYRRLGAVGSAAVVSLMAFYLLVAFGAESWRRFVRHQQFDPNALGQVLRQSQNRPAYTAALLRELKLEDRGQIKIAMTEVQLRYVVDRRVEVLSLDGRTSPQIVRYMDRDGVPDFRGYLLKLRPDALELGQWASAEEWYGRLVRRRVRPNLVGEISSGLKGRPDGSKIMVDGIEGTKRGHFAVLGYGATRQLPLRARIL